MEVGFESMIFPTQIRKCLSTYFARATSSSQRLSGAGAADPELVR